ncbi:MAG: zinc ribbon domain-containing protein [Chloroflexi bacterium]|nr:MAG: zinc ribbon domain-containing protein [Chloroflexota bacterium]
MSDVSRVCSQCGGKVALDSRFCGNCGYDTTAGLPVVTQRNLPAQIATVALPVAAGLASWAVRAGWKLLRARLEDMAKNPPAVVAQRPAPAARRTVPVQQASERPKRTIRIRSTWAVGDGKGVWRQGAEEHIIEFDE